MARKTPEHMEQIQLVQKCREAVQSGRFPELDLIYAVPNGGLRTRREAGAFQREGVKKGIPDLCLPVARGGWFSFYIEMKAKGGRIDPAQKELHPKLQAEGNKVGVYWTWQDAWAEIERYLELPRLWKPQTNEE